MTASNCALHVLEPIQGVMKTSMPRSAEGGKFVGENGDGKRTNQNERCSRWR